MYPRYLTLVTKPLFSLPVLTTNPLKLTVQLPTPPDLVTTITSPLPLAAPVLAMILLGECHSAESKQSSPQIRKASKRIIQSTQVR